MLIKDKLNDKSSMTDNEKDIASYFINLGDAIKDKTVRDIAKATFSSASSVVRLCKKLGFEGYNDFKDKYIEETKYLYRNFNHIDSNFPFSKDDISFEIPHKITSLYTETIKDTVELLNESVYMDILELLNDSKTIYIVTSGDTYDLAGTFKSKMLKIGKRVVINKRTDETFYEINNCDKNSAFIVISYSGETPSIIRLAKEIKRNSLPLVAITSIGGNTLSTLTKNLLYISSHERLVSNIGNFSSTISILFILDIIYSGIFKYNYDDNYKNKTEISSNYEINRNTNNPYLKKILWNNVPKFANINLLYWKRPSRLLCFLDLKFWCSYNHIKYNYRRIYEQHRTI